MHEAINGDNESDHDDSNDEELNDDQWEEPQEEPQQQPDPLDKPRLFNLDGPSVPSTPSDLPNVIRDEEDTITDNPTAELLKVHHDFGHPSFKKVTGNGKAWCPSTSTRNMQRPSMLSVPIRKSNATTMAIEDRAELE